MTRSLTSLHPHLSAHFDFGAMLLPVIAQRNGLIGLLGAIADDPPHRATAAEVENRVTRPMEKLLWEIPGVEYLYSTSSPGRSSSAR